MLSITSLKKMILGRRWLVLFFLVFLALQLFQSFIPSWDSLVYLYNAKWLLGEKIYFEFLRPPLPALADMLSGAGAYSTQISALLASLCYFASVLFLFEKENAREKMGEFVFALFAFLFPSILFFSNFGSDLFAISFLLLALAIESPRKKGFFFGLASLARYNFFIYIIIPLAYLKRKDWAEFLAPIFLLWLPWLAFNFLATGNPLFSVGESLLLNVFQRGILSGFGTAHIIYLAVFFLSVFLPRESAKSRFSLAGILSSLQFVVSGIKESRFLALLAPLQAVNFARMALSKKAKFFLALAAASLIVFVVFSGALSPAPPAVPEKEAIGNCRVVSDKWVFFLEEGMVAEPLPSKESFKESLDSGAVLVVYDKDLFCPAEFADYGVKETPDYFLVKPLKCAPMPDRFELRVWRGLSMKFIN